MTQGEGAVLWNQGSSPWRDTCLRLRAAPRTVVAEQRAVKGRITQPMGKFASSALVEQKSRQTRETRFLPDAWSPRSGQASRVRGHVPA